MEKLREIFKSCRFELAASKGKKNISDAGDIFCGGIVGFKKKGKSKSTPATKIAVFATNQEGGLLHFFSEFREFGKDLQSLSWTESQVVQFSYEFFNELLTEEEETLLLLEGEDRVAEIEYVGGGLSAREVFLTDPKIYQSCRIIIPAKD